VEEISSDSDDEKHIDTEAPRKLRGAVTRPRKFLDEVDSGAFDHRFGADGSSNGGDSSSRIGDGSSTDLESVSAAAPAPNNAKRRRLLSGQGGGGGQGSQRKYVRKPSDGGSSGVLPDNRSNSVLVSFLFVRACLALALFE
jgi:hypothetical protein